ncbi:MAG: hypothetical protein ACKV2T_28270 [Kofleriaceae bacterium]
MNRCLHFTGLACTVIACSEPVVTVQPYTVVTVNARPAVHDATTLRVTLSNGGARRTEDLELTQAFPVTFSVSAPERDGDLRIDVEAIDASDFVVGRGSTGTTIDAESANLVLDSMDFVVNTDVAGDQFPSDDFEANGFQVGAAADGLWTVTFHDQCDTAPCALFARRFDLTGKVVTTRVAAGTNAFPLTTTPTNFVSVPATATAGPATLLVWDFAELSPSLRDGVACRSLDTQGNATPVQLEIAADPSSDVVSIAPLSNQNFVVAWRTIGPTTNIRGAIVRADCTPVAAPVNVSTLPTPTRPAVTAQLTGTNVLYAWIVSGGVHVRIANLTNSFGVMPDTEFLPATATEVVESVRVAPLGQGFAILVRWALATGFDGPGRIELYRTNAAGAVLGGATVVTTKSGSDPGSYDGFGVATNAAGTMFVTWHSCNANGDGQGCGVYGRAFDANGSPVTGEIVIPTTTVGDQSNPSVAALPDDAFVVVWRDDSGQAPDTSGSAVRARIVYVSDP